jgi:hypothetical protein
MTDQSKKWGQIKWDTPANKQAAAQHHAEQLQLIVATR